jgi:hypothetical protein
VQIPPPSNMNGFHPGDICFLLIQENRPILNKMNATVTLNPETKAVFL